MNTHPITQEWQKGLVGFVVVFLAFSIPLLPLARIIVNPLLGGVKEFLVFFVLASCLPVLLKRLVSTVPLSLGTCLTGLFIAYGIAHVWISNRGVPDAVESVRYMLMYPAFSIVMYFILGNDGSGPEGRFVESKLLLVFDAIFISSILVALIGMYEAFINPRFTDLYGSSGLRNGYLGLDNLRIVSTLENPITLGIFMQISLMACVFLVGGKLSLLRRGVIFIGVLLFCFITLRTLSRGAILVMGVLGVYLGVSTFLFGRLKAKILLLLFGLALYAAYSFFANAGSADGTVGFLDVLQHRIFELGQSFDQGYDPRVITWQITIFSFLKSSTPIEIMFGNGLGNIGWTKGSFVMENSYFAIIYELGVFGLLLYMAVLLRFAFNAFTLRFHPNPILRNFGKFMLVFLMAYFLFMIISDAHLGLPLVYYFWIFFGFSEIFVQYKDRLDSGKPAGTIFPAGNKL